MKLANLAVNGFVEELASDSPAPGGGSAAALEGALGAALTAMVCTLTTVGKSKETYADYQEFVIETRAKASDLQARFVDVMDRDTEAFNVVSAAFGMPKATGEEKAARSAAIQGAWLNVLINIGSLKNKELAADYRVKGEAMLAKALPLADKVYETVVGLL